MRIPALVILMMTVTGCATAPVDSVICDRTEKPATDHAEALAEDGGAKSVSTGRVLIATLDAGCGR